MRRVLEMNPQQEKGEMDVLAGMRVAKTAGSWAGGGRAPLASQGAPARRFLQLCVIVGTRRGD